MADTSYVWVTKTLTSPSRPLTNLDTNIVAGLVDDDFARDEVRKRRDAGATILLSPSIIREIARTPAKERRFALIDAATKYCDGFTNLTFQDLFALEIEGINEGKVVPELPIVPASELLRLRDDGFAARTAGNLDARRLRTMYKQALKLTKDEIPPSDAADGFEPFLRRWMGPIFSDFLMKPARETGAVKNVRLLPEGQRVHHDKRGITVAIVLVAANLYRSATGTALKAEGCFSDVYNVMEIAHSETLLTRDVELSECGKLLRSVVSDTRLDIVLVPRP